ncbi:MAG: hypothetical protein HKL95_04625 [Phycisphaerae bacterium]|nr:hypothetical protein [Phycisphaerae bacterium]
MGRCTNGPVLGGALPADDSMMAPFETFITLACLKVAADAKFGGGNRKASVLPEDLANMRCLVVTLLDAGQTILKLMALATSNAAAAMDP